MREEIESERETERVTFFSKQKWRKSKIWLLSVNILTKRESKSV